MGRPAKGALSTYSAEIRERIKSLRGENEGWGAISILVELELEGHTPQDLPSSGAVHRFLVEQGYIKYREPREPLTVKPPIKRSRYCHQKWEMDAKGTVKVGGIAPQALIDIKDDFSRKYCMCFPVDVANTSTQPSTRHYKWALRLAFIESGMPKNIQVDKDSAFIENASKSPFPSKLHLWLLALGIDLQFITKPPPAQNNIVERSHLTLFNQALKRKQYPHWRALFDRINYRRKVLNENYPSRTMGKKAPLQVYPQAAHSKRVYSIRKEKQLLDIGRIYRFLGKGKWHRKVAQNKCVYLGRQHYYINHAVPGTMLTLKFSSRTKQLIFYDVNELEFARMSIKGISKEELMAGTTKELIQMHKKLYQSKKFPL